MKRTKAELIRWLEERQAILDAANRTREAILAQREPTDLDWELARDAEIEAEAISDLGETLERSVRFTW